MNISIEEIKNYWDRMRFYDMAKTFGFEKYLTKKEVKKVNKIPYFETKVVRVKGGKGHKHFFEPAHNGEIKCLNCGKVFTLHDLIKAKQPKGNWVNGENLDKIKFPCFCSYKVAENVRHYGQLNKGFLQGKYYYFITDESQQYDDSNCEQFYSNLKDLIIDFNVHIKRGKIIIFEEGE
uniref:Uncharacterized protein n=1 Tax=viral metagenome TaxID=1070528 RepID=A0A6M3KBX7_9ZZZZ